MHIYRIIIQPRPFQSGDPVRHKPSFGNPREGKFLRKDGDDRSFIEVEGNPASVYTYQLYHVAQA